MKKCYNLIQIYSFIRIILYDDFLNVYKKHYSHNIYLDNIIMHTYIQLC